MLKTYIKTFRDFNPNLRILLISAALVGFTFFGVFSALFNIFLLRLGFDTQSIGQVNGAGWLAYALLCVPGGALSRRIGIQRVLMIGLGLMSGGCAFSAFPGLIDPILSKSWVLFSAILSKIGFALFFPNLTSALITYCRPEERSHIFSAEWALYSLGGFVGTFAGGQTIGILANLLGVSIQNPALYQYIFLAGALLLALAIWPVSRLGATHADTYAENIHRTSRTPLFLFILMASIFFLYVFGEQGIGFFTVFLDTRLNIPISGISSLLAVVGLLNIPIILLMPFVTTRLGKRSTIFFFLLIMSLCFVLIAFASDFAPIAIFYLILSFTVSITRPTYSLFSQTRVVAEWRPVMSGAVSTMSGLGCAFNSVLGGRLISLMGFSTFWQACAVVTALSAVIFGISFITPGWVAQPDRVGND